MNKKVASVQRKTLKELQKGFLLKKSLAESITVVYSSTHSELQLEQYCK